MGHPAILFVPSSSYPGYRQQTARTLRRTQGRLWGTRLPKSESSASKIFRHSGITVAFKTTFAVFTRVGPDNSLERLTECSVGLVTDRPSDVDEFLVTLLE